MENGIAVAEDVTLWTKWKRDEWKLSETKCQNMRKTKNEQNEIYNLKHKAIMSVRVDLQNGNGNGNTNNNTNTNGKVLPYILDVQQ